MGHAETFQSLLFEVGKWGYSQGTVGYTKPTYINCHLKAF